MNNCNETAYRPVMGVQIVVISKAPINRDIPLAKYIIEAACILANITEDEFKGPCRKREYCEARQIAVKLIRDKCRSLSFDFIGKMIGGRDHSTVIYSIETANDLIISDKYFKKKYTELEKMFTKNANAI